MALTEKAGYCRLIPLFSATLAAAACAFYPITPAHSRAQRGEIAEAVRQAQNSVVSIRTFAAAGDTGLMRVGSGFLFDKRFVVTGRSVVASSDSVEIELSDGRVSRGRLIETDPSSEIIVLEHGLDGVEPVRMGRSENAAAGTQLAILGNSLGIFPSVTLARYMRKRPDGLMEIDGTVPPGNCGSPVLDAAGRLVGMIVGRLQDPAYPSRIISLAVSVEKIGSMLVRFQRDMARSGWIGISVVDLEPVVTPESGNAAVKPSSARRRVLRSETDRSAAGEKQANQGLKPILTRVGVRVVAVVSGGPADRAGIAVGDTIMAVMGNAVSGARQVAELMKTVPPNSRVAFSIRKGGLESEKTVTVTGRPRIHP